MGDCKKYLTEAQQKIKNEDINIIAATEVLRTNAKHIKTQNIFYNMGVLIETNLSPENLLDILKKIEINTGRIHRVQYGPREIDIDIVWWSHGEYHNNILEIPHKYNFSREWVRCLTAELIPENHIDKKKYTNMKYKSIESGEDFKKKKAAKEKISMVTVYDYSTALILSRSSIDTVLVGDSLGNVFQGQKSTIPVTLENMIYHGKAVRRGLPDAFIVIDMPFLSYHTSVQDAIQNAGKLVQETGANCIKLEGGSEFINEIQGIIRAGIPVMGHLGLQPQSILHLEGYRVQGRSPEAKNKIINDALLLEKAGVIAIIAEMIPADLAKELSEKLTIPLIGIGAGSEADGQILVINDLLGFNPDFTPKFVRTYSNISQIILDAIENYNSDVRSGNFPSDSESFK